MMRKVIKLICVFGFLSLVYLLWSAKNNKIVWLTVILKIAPIGTLQCYVLLQLLSMVEMILHVLSSYLLHYYFHLLETFY